MTGPARHKRRMRSQARCSPQGFLQAKSTKVILRLNVERKWDVYSGWYQRVVDTWTRPLLVVAPHLESNVLPYPE